MATLKAKLLIPVGGDSPLHPNNGGSIQAVIKTVAKILEGREAADSGNYYAADVSLEGTHYRWSQYSAKYVSVTNLRGEVDLVEPLTESDVTSLISETYTKKISLMEALNQRLKLLEQVQESTGENITNILGMLNQEKLVDADDANEQGAPNTSTPFKLSRRSWA